jgi:hypothetical protein
MVTNCVTEHDLFRLHKQARKDSQQTRYTLNHSLDPRRVLSRQIESEVADRLAEQGYTVTRMPHKERFDLLVNGVRVEVKAATWDGYRYQANLHGNRADVLVMACVDGCTRHFVIPFDRVSGLTVIKVTSHDPHDYIGRWTPFFERWELIDDLIASGFNSWQLPMIDAEKGG